MPDPTIYSNSPTSDDFHLTERSFLLRVAAGARMNRWIKPILDDIQFSHFPQLTLYGFIHWINQDPDCPWLILTDTLEYGRRSVNGRQLPLSTDFRAPLHWSIGSYRRRVQPNNQADAYCEQIGVSLLFNDELSPVALQCTQRGIPATRCHLNPTALTTSLAKLHR